MPNYNPFFTQQPGIQTGTQNDNPFFISFVNGESGAHVASPPNWR